MIRKTDFISERTFAIKANKAAFELSRDLLNLLKKNKINLEVILKDRLEKGIDF